MITQEERYETYQQTRSRTTVEMAILCRRIRELAEGMRATCGCGCGSRDADGCDNCTSTRMWMVEDVMGAVLDGVVPGWRSGFSMEVYADDWNREKTPLISWRINAREYDDGAMAGQTKTAV